MKITPVPSWKGYFPNVSSSLTALSSIVGYQCHLPKEDLERRISSNITAMYWPVVSLLTCVKESSEVAIVLVPIVDDLIVNISVYLINRPRISLSLKLSAVIRAC